MLHLGTFCHQRVGHPLI
uniref:Uncharacterized protein n=1 Tax=Anguilla anguilla TaxID=7936 RepID=A0A0E9R7U3_ANGAN